MYGSCVPFVILRGPPPSAAPTSIPRPPPFVAPLETHPFRPPSTPYKDDDRIRARVPRPDPDLLVGPRVSFARLRAAGDVPLDDGLDDPDAQRRREDERGRPRRGLRREDGVVGELVVDGLGGGAEFGGHPELSRASREGGAA